MAQKPLNRMVPLVRQNLCQFLRIGRIRNQSSPLYWVVRRPVRPLMYQTTVHPLA